MAATLPTVQQASESQAALEQVLSTLLEPSESLKQRLVPSLSSSIVNGAVPRPSTYADLVDASEQEVGKWSADDRADFLGGHPRIGEVKNLSALSSKEQSGATPTPPEVLAKLQTLNALYESRFPRLKYVTFVAGRSRAQIAQELENFLMGRSNDSATGKDSEGISTAPIETFPPGSPEWNAELGRGTRDVFRIAKARLQGMGLQ